MNPAAQLSAEYRFTPAPAVPRYITSVINRVSDRFWESYFHINTRGNAASPHPDAHRYGYLAYHSYFSIFDRLRIGESDVVADVGCGKGRVSCLAAHHQINRSIGIEIDPALWKIARANGARMCHRRSPLNFICGSAVDFDYDDVTVVTLFHPFGADTMRAVLANWEESLRRRPREFRIVYCNPLLSPILAAKPFLRLFECWNPGTWSRIKFPIHFYRHV
jgi:SAM-dependent methyltransferase